MLSSIIPGNFTEFTETTKTWLDITQGDNNEIEVIIAIST